MHEVHGDTVNEAKIATGLAKKDVDVDANEKNVEDMGKMIVNDVAYVFSRNGEEFAFNSVQKSDEVINVVNHIFKSKAELSGFIEKLKEGLK